MRYNHRIHPERRQLINGGEAPEDRDYPCLAHSITPEGLHLKYPSIFPRVPTEIDIIQSLILQGDYNLGELLQWLSIRSRVLSLLQQRKRGQVDSLKIDGTCIRLYELVRDGVITFIHRHVIYMDSKDRRIYKLLLGLRTEVNVRETDYGIVLTPKRGNDMHIDRRLMRAYGIVRMCMVYYSTDLENKARLV